VRCDRVRSAHRASSGGYRLHVPEARLAPRDGDHAHAGEFAAFLVAQENEDLLQRLLVQPRLVAPDVAARLLLTGEVVRGQQAKELGLVTEVRQTRLLLCAVCRARVLLSGSRGELSRVLCALCSCRRSLLSVRWRLPTASQSCRPR
jgi:hypothetical protein